MLALRTTSQDSTKRIFLALVLSLGAFIYSGQTALALEQCDLNLLKDGKPVTVKGACDGKNTCDVLAKEDPNAICVPNADCATKNPNLGYCWYSGKGYSATDGTAAGTNPAEVTKTVSDKDRLIIPNLGVDIPGLTFTQNIPRVPCTGRTGECMTIPFLAEYIVALYKYALGIGLVAAAIMFIYGAFLYIVGATGLQIQSAKEKMTEAIIGLVILLASYAILANVSPSVVSLKPIEVDRIQGLMADLNAMESNRTNPTADPTTAMDYAITSSAMPESCPFILTAKRSNFFKGVLSKVTTGTFEERLPQVAEYVIGCKMNLLDCGTTASYILALSGVGKTDCLLKEGASCNNDISKAFVGGGGWDKIGGAKVTMGHWCKAECPNNCCKVNCDKRKTPPVLCETTGRDGCTDGTPNDAKTAMRKKIEAMTSDYPDKIADNLKPGDFVWTYTANKQCDGLHSALFIKWIDRKKGTAVTLEGQIDKNVRYRNRCYKKACNGGVYEPIIRYNRPNPKFFRDGITSSATP